MLFHVLVAVGTDASADVQGASFWLDPMVTRPGPVSTPSSEDCAMLLARHVLPAGITTGVLVASTVVITLLSFVAPSHAAPLSIALVTSAARLAMVRGVLVPVAATAAEAAGAGAICAAAGTLRSAARIIGIRRFIVNSIPHKAASRLRWRRSSARRSGRRQWPAPMTPIDLAPIETSLRR